MKAPLFQEEFLIKQFGSSDAAKAVLTVYLEEEDNLVEPLRRSKAEGFSLEELDESSHKIKGSLDLIGSKSLSKLAADICDFCRSDQREKAQESLSKLCDGLAQLRVEISTYLA